VFYVRGLHTQAGENPELRTLFFRLAHLLRYPITPIFVFDGPERPDFKRGTTVKKKEHWVVKYLIELIKDFRYKFHMVRWMFL
jgi:Holliday junction resolvase YEN1